MMLAIHMSRSMTAVLSGLATKNLEGLPADAPGGRAIASGDGETLDESPRQLRYAGLWTYGTSHTQPPARRMSGLHAARSPYAGLRRRVTDANGQCVLGSFKRDR